MSLYRVFGGSVKGLDPQVLLDSLEEQLDLPSVSVELGSGQGRQIEIIGQKNERSVVFGIVILHPAELFRVMLRRIDAGKQNRLIAHDSR